MRRYMLVIMVFALLAGLSFSHYGDNRDSTTDATDDPSAVSGDRTGAADDSIDNEVTGDENRDSTTEIDSDDEADEGNDEENDSRSDSDEVRAGGSDCEEIENLRIHTACEKRQSAIAEKDCDNITNDRLKRVCEGDVEHLNRLDCSSANLTEVDAQLCLRQVVAYRARLKVSERHDLSEQCRNMTGDERSQCQERVNSIFRDEIQSDFVTWIRERNNLTGEQRDLDSNTRSTAREELRADHQERVAELENETDNDNIKGLLHRLDNVIDVAESKAVKMEHAINRVKDRGHDVSELQYLIEKYYDTIDSARVYYDNQEYRDSVASLKEGQRVFTEFKKKLGEIVSEDKQGILHETDEENAFSPADDQSEDDIEPEDGEGT